MVVSLCDSMMCLLRIEWVLLVIGLFMLLFFISMV